MNVKFKENHRQPTRQARAQNESGSLGYIQAISAQLAEIARTDGHGALAGLLEMAVLEAASASKKKRAPQMASARFVSHAPGKEKNANNENSRSL